MMPPFRWFTTYQHKLPLRFVLVVPFLLQTAGVATLVGYLSVTVVPECDFTTEIHRKVQTTLLLIEIILLLSTALGLLIAGWVTRPIWQSWAAAKRMAREDLNTLIERDRQDELGEFTRSFDQMVLQVQMLADYNRQLETQVAEHTSALRESEARNRAILSTIPDLISLVNVDGIYLDSIQRNSQFDLVPGEIDPVGKHISELLPPEVAAQKLQVIQQVIQTGVVQTYEQQLQVGDRLQYEELRVVPCSKDTALVIIRDITTRKQVELELQRAKESAEAASHAKSTFLANISHELRTPLSAMLGYAQLMASDLNTTRSQQMQLDIINRNGEYLLQLINDILSLSKIEAGRATLEEKNFDLYALLDTLEGMFRLRAEVNGLKFNCNRSFDVPQYIYGDECKIRQIISNLLDNAIKFTEAGSVTLNVKAEMGKCIDKNKATGSEIARDKEFNIKTEPARTRCDLPLLRIEVEDTGVGIAAEELNQIFEVFVQATVKRHSQQGTGLGLSICRRFVQMMGGNITVQSQLGLGTLFRADIPIQPIDAKQFTGTQVPQRVLALAPNQSSHRILVVDDTDTNRQLLVHRLKTVGFEVQEAKNGQEAIEQWLSFDPDLIWMDIRMPVMDGFEAVQQIRRKAKAKRQKDFGRLPESQFEQPKIIAVTAAVFEEERQRILTVGCDDFVAKPCSETLIFEKMAQHLGVKYLYAEKVQRKLKPQTNANHFLSHVNISETSLKPASLKIMSDSWIARLNYAARSANERMISELLKEIPMSHADLKTEIVELVNNFQLADLIRLTERPKVGQAHDF